MDNRILEQYMDSRRMYRWDGVRGVENLKTLVRDMAGHESVEEFLIDNPGAMECILDWIAKTRAPEWDMSLVYATDTGE